MKLYKRPYLNMFSEICTTIETLESLLNKSILPIEAATIIKNEIGKLKIVQQKSEEFIISD